VAIADILNKSAQRWVPVIHEGLSTLQGGD
jgi:hypothetical protein